MGIQLTLQISIQDFNEVERLLAKHPDNSAKIGKSREEHFGLWEAVHVHKGGERMSVWKTAWEGSYSSWRP
jgi:hypothetical protein